MGAFLFSDGRPIMSTAAGCIFLFEVERVVSREIEPVAHLLAALLIPPKRTATTRTRTRTRSVVFLEVP
jgi:hypothetical protein